jgi:hypothetical protein
MENRNKYESPKLTVVTFKAEYGYAGSDVKLYQPAGSPNSPMEGYEKHGSWTSGSNSFWD